METITTKYDPGQRMWVIGKESGRWEPVARGTIHSAYITIDDKGTYIKYNFVEEAQTYYEEDVLYPNSAAAYDECDNRNDPGGKAELDRLLKEALDVGHVTN